MTTDHTKPAKEFYFCPDIMGVIQDFSLGSQEDWKKIFKKCINTLESRIRLMEALRDSRLERGESSYVSSEVYRSETFRDLCLYPTPDHEKKFPFVYGFDLIRYMDIRYPRREMLLGDVRCNQSTRAASFGVVHGRKKYRLPLKRILQNHLAENNIRFRRSGPLEYLEKLVFSF